MGKLVRISDELHQVLKSNEDVIKADYLTTKLFVDSAIRAALRKKNIPVGDDQIIAHLDKLRESKARHINQQILIRKRNNHKRRVKRQLEKLEEIVGETNV